MRATALHLTVAMLLAAPILGAGSALADQSGAGDSAAAAWSESGEASWYGPRHEGMRTTSGEVFDGSRMTAAHSSLPIGSYVRVTLQRSGRSIIVRVNDREPPHGVRCIDLSRAAAARLGIVERDPCAYRATWSATYAPRAPIGFSVPAVLSRTVCSSSSAFSSAPTSTASALT